jgi:hypothetical protein
MGDFFLLVDFDNFPSSSANNFSSTNILYLEEKVFWLGKDVTSSKTYHCALLRRKIFNVVLESIVNKQTHVLGYADDIDIIGKSQVTILGAFWALEKGANKEDCGDQRKQD